MTDTFSVRRVGVCDSSKSPEVKTSCRSCTRGVSMGAGKRILSSSALLVMTVLTLGIGSKVVGAQLLVDFYAATCPKAESIVSAAVQQATASDPFMPAKLLRLFFHDCFVNGCDGSILIDPSPSDPNPEKADPVNASVDGYAVIDAAKATLETVCSGTVSCADIVALAAQDGILLAGGPPSQMSTGRRDGLVSDGSLVGQNIPVPTSNLNTMLSMFSAKGLNINDLVILAGAHTIGVAHCFNMNNRVTYSSNGSATIVDPTLAPSFAQTLMTSCPQNAPSTATMSLDPYTDQIFDIQYYVALQDAEGLLTSDEVLFTDPRTRPLINTFATNQVEYFENWGPSFVALGNLGVLTGTSGEIRTNCRKFNVNNGTG